MKGAIFIALNEMVEMQYGITVWEELLAEVKPESEGIYTSTQDYSDEEMMRFIHVAAKKLNFEKTDLVRYFGKFLFSELNRRYPIFTQLNQDFFLFICSIEKVIHKEVRKLYENPGLPTMDCEHLTDKDLIVNYQSPRKLCYLAEGLIYGAAEHFKRVITIDHHLCMHDGHDQCQFIIHAHD